MDEAVEEESLRESKDEAGEEDGIRERDVTH